LRGVAWHRIGGGEKNTSTIASAGWRPIHRRRDRRALLEVVKTPWTEPLVTQRVAKIKQASGADLEIQQLILD
jgi:hypothetical protein